MKQNGKSFFFFFNDTAVTEIYTLSLHDALPISAFKYKGQAIDVRKVARELGVHYVVEGSVRKAGKRVRVTVQLIEDRKSTRLNSSHVEISYAVFCLKKKKSK